MTDRYYPGPSVADVVRRLETADVDDGLIEAYIAEENRRNPSQWQRSIADFNRAMRSIRIMFGPRYTRADYTLAGPSKGAGQ